MKRKNISLIILLVIVTLFSLSGCKKDIKQESANRTEFMMDTVMNIKVYGTEDEKVLDAAFERIEEIENKMSRTIKDSDINLINENAGIRPVQVSDETYFVVEMAKKYAELSDGAYDPTIGPLVDLWDIQGEGKIDREHLPAKEDILDAKKRVDFNKLELLDDNHIYLSERDMILDLGGIAKGYAADEVKRVLKENGVEGAIIDLGGDLYALGSKPADKPWKIGIQNPFEVRGSYVGILEIKDKSIVTSGDYERYFEIDGTRYHHIIDSKEGYPTNNELSAVTIVSDSSTEGDTISTAVFVLGKEKGLELIEDLGVEAMIVTKDRKVYMTESLKENFELKNDSFKIK